MKCAETKAVKDPSNPTPGLRHDGRRDQAGPPPPPGPRCRIAGGVGQLSRPEVFDQGGVNSIDASSARAFIWSLDQRGHISLDPHLGAGLAPK